MTIHSDAADGLLNPKTIRSYGKDKIDEVDANSTLTPLIADQSWANQVS